MKLAYIDDDTDSALIFSRKFRQESSSCDIFSSAEEALPSALKGSYDALIVDIRLPGLSGVEFLSRLRQAQIFTPCVLITAFNSMALAKQALNASANYLLEKPFSFSELRHAIEKITQSPGPLQLHVDRSLKQLALTGREEEIARFVLKGLSNGEIADVLKLSEKTVKQYVSQIFDKSHAKSRSEFFSIIFPV